MEGVTGTTPLGRIAGDDWRLMVLGGVEVGLSGVGFPTEGGKKSYCCAH